MNYKEHTILIVDDEQDILDLIKFNVENLGFKTVTADNGFFLQLQMRELKILI